MDGAVEAAREALKGWLEFRVTYVLAGADPRPRPYGDGDYVPERLNVVFQSMSAEDGKLPRYKDLHCDKAELVGWKLRKDGTPGHIQVRENLYSRSKLYPAWVTEIIEREVAKLKNQGALWSTSA